MEKVNSKEAITMDNLWASLCELTIRLIGWELKYSESPSPEALDTARKNLIAIEEYYTRKGKPLCWK